MNIITVSTDKIIPDYSTKRLNYFAFCLIVQRALYYNVYLHLKQILINSLECASGLWVNYYKIKCTLIWRGAKAFPFSLSCILYMYMESIVEYPPQERATRMSSDVELWSQTR